MADLKPIGSEKLTGQEKLKRIMEIALYKDVAPVNQNQLETKEYSIGLSDGKEYQIIKEKMGYIIKKTISESETDYIEPMKNRKYFSSYSQALKKLNLMAKEINRLTENEEGTSLFGEQKKFVLKTPKPVEPEMEQPAPPAEPPSVPSPELPSSDMPDPMSSDETPVDSEVDIDLEKTDVEPDMGGDNEPVSFKAIQKLTGKLTQKIREFENEEGLTSEDMKYVINMVLSSLDLQNLSDEDKEDVLSKFESEEEDMGSEFMPDSEEDIDSDEDITSDTEVEKIQSNMDVPVESEFDESYSHSNSKKYETNEFYFADEEDFSDVTPKHNETGSFDKSSSNMFGSFGDDHGWYDESDSKFGGNFDFEYDEEEFDEFDPMYQKYGGKTKWFGSEDEGKTFFDRYKKKFGSPMKVRVRKNMDNQKFNMEESKVDRVISKYFEISESEKKQKVNKIQEMKLKRKSELSKKMDSVRKLSETVEQELASQKFLEENNEYKFLGKTNKKNLVFENKEEQVKISPEGLVL